MCTAWLPKTKKKTEKTRAICKTQYAPLPWKQLQLQITETFAKKMNGKTANNWNFSKSKAHNSVKKCLIVKLNLT